MLAMLHRCAGLGSSFRERHVSESPSFHLITLHSGQQFDAIETSLVRQIVDDCYYISLAATVTAHVDRTHVVSEQSNLLLKMCSQRQRRNFWRAGNDLLQKIGKQRVLILPVLQRQLDR